MTEIRRATVVDAEAIGEQRVHMFVDAEVKFAVAADLMAANFVEWLRPKLVDGSYTGWVVDGDGGLVAGAGLWVMEWPPHFMDAEPRRAYLLNFYVAPKMRRQGLARRLVTLAVDEAKARGIKVVTLHASKFGRPVYEQYGFASSTEMMLRPRDSAG
jgi:ribosomal protein S18 acetylase RimI-like enzyme